MPTHDEKRAKQKREQRAREHKLKDDLLLLAHLVCESHSISQRTMRLSRMVRVIAELNRSTPMNEYRRIRLITHIINSSDANASDITTDNGMISVNTPFNIDPKLLADKIIW